MDGNTQSPEPDWSRLAAHIRRRRDELGRKQQQCVDLAFVIDPDTGEENRLISIARWRDLEAGRYRGPGGRLFDGVDRGLRWQVGSTEQILAGGEPTVVEAESEPESDELVEIKRALERHDRHLVEVLARLTAVAASVTAVAITLDDLLGK